MVNYTLVGSSRVGRTEFEFTYRAQVTNNGADAVNVIAQAASSSPYTTILEGELQFGHVAAGATKDSIDTFTIKQNRSHPVDWSAVVWDLRSLSGIPDDVDLGLHTDESQGGGGLIGGPVRITNGNSLEMRTDPRLASPHAGAVWPLPLCITAAATPGESWDMVGRTPTGPPSSLPYR